MEDLGFTVAFFVLAAAAVGGGLAVVSVRNIFHAALFLALSFLAVGGLFLTLQADFLGVVQVLLYAGAVGVLVVFAIMLTHNPAQGNQSTGLRWSALVVAGLLAVAIVWTVLRTPWAPSGQLPLQDTVPALAEAFFGPYVLPFEVASVVLLAAMVGAIVLAREDQP